MTAVLSQDEMQPLNVCGVVEGANAYFVKGRKNAEG